MSENIGANGSQEPSSKERSSAVPPKASGPTQGEREGLIDALQAYALQRPDPLAANLLMLCAELVIHATRVNQALAKENPEAPVNSSAYKAYEKKIELQLKVNRQIDRLVGIQRQQSAAETE